MFFSVTQQSESNAGVEWGEGVDLSSDKHPTALVCAATWLDISLMTLECQNIKTGNILPTFLLKYIFKWSTHHSETVVHCFLHLCVYVTQACSAAADPSIIGRSGARGHTQPLHRALFWPGARRISRKYYISQIIIIFLGLARSSRCLVHCRARCGDRRTPLWEMVQPALQVSRHRFLWSHHETAPENLRCFHRIALRRGCSGGSGGLTSLALRRRRSGDEGWQRTRAPRWNMTHARDSDTVWAASEDPRCVSAPADYHSFLWCFLLRNSRRTSWFWAAASDGDYNASLVFVIFDLTLNILNWCNFVLNLHA